MKSIHSLATLLSIILLTILFSCSSNKENTTLCPELAHVDSIMYQHPDSALKLLETMPVPAASDRLDHATWCLFLTQARYKNFLTQSSDSLINIAFDYFMAQDDPQRKAMVWYYKGILNDEWDNKEEALSYYLEANKYLEMTNDYQLGYLINIGIGNIYAYRQLSDYAKTYFEAANRYAELSGNQIYIAGSWQYIARLYTIQSLWKESIKYYLMAEEAVKPTGFRILQAAIVSELAGIYRQTGDYALTIEKAKEALSLVDDQNQGATYKVLGHTYFNMQRYDSAHYYLEKAVDAETVYTRGAVHHLLCELCKAEKDYVKAFEYNDKYLLCLDSVLKLDRNKALIEMQEKYNQEKVLNEKNLLKIEKDRAVRNALWISVALLAMIALIIFLYQRALIRKQQTIRKNEEELRQSTLKIRENESLIARNETRMKELSQEIAQNNDIQEQMEEQQKVLQDIWRQNQALYADNRSLQENINRYSSTLKEKGRELDALKRLSEENQRLHEREQFLCSQLVRKTEVLYKLRQSPKYQDPVQWEEIRESIDALYDNYTARLSKQFPSFTESDLQVCCLIKLRLGIPEIATLLGISPASVSKRKMRVKERIIQDLGKPFDENQTLDIWIWEY